MITQHSATGFSGRTFERASERFLAVLALTRPLGEYMARVCQGQRTWLDPVVGPAERAIYRLSGVDPQQEHGWRAYVAAMLLFNLFGLMLTYTILRAQEMLPFNPRALVGTTPDLAFNTEVSFASNTNWQAYAGETTMSYLSQMAALAVHNFTSAATGMAIAIALVRGIARRSVATIVPAMFVATYPELGALNIMRLATPESAILSAVIFNAVVIVALVPLALKGVGYRRLPAAQLLQRNLLVYGVGSFECALQPPEMRPRRDQDAVLRERSGVPPRRWGLARGNHPVAPSDMAHDLNPVFKALADPTRRLLLDRLFDDNGQTLGALCSRLDMSRQAVTKHLDLLEAANLVVTVRRGREKLHYLNPEPIEEIAERWIGRYERRRLQALRDLKRAAEEE